MMEQSLTTRIIQCIDDALQQNREQNHRDYLGASQLGTPCDRQLQYGLWQTPVDDGKALDGLSLRRFCDGSCV